MTFDELFAVYADRVYAYLRFKLRDAHMVEDIFQETFLALYRHMTERRLPESPKAWLLTIAHRKLVDRLRRTNRESAAPATFFEGVEQQLPDETNRLLAEEMLNRLKEPERSIVYGLYVEGLSVAEMAQMLELPEGTVKSKCHYAKKKLLRWLEEDAHD